MIQSFCDKESERIFARERSGRLPPSIQRTALRKLWILHAAHELMDLKVPPGNRLEKLTGNRSGQYSVRINDQWRICFRWNQGHVHDVEITDYH